MAKDKKKFTLPQSEYLEKHSNEEFVLIAMPTHLVEEIDRVRDAIVTYMPGYDEKDFVVLRKFLAWVDNIDELLCVKDGE